MDKLMIEVQEIFDNEIVLAWLEQLTALGLQKIFEDPIVKQYTNGIR